MLNVAAGKAPMQISTEGTGIPQKAIDGSTSAFYTPETCSITKAERVPWWYVNLLEPYMVQLVRLDFGKSCCGKCFLFFTLFCCILLQLCFLNYIVVVYCVEIETQMTFIPKKKMRFSVYKKNHY